MNMTLAAESFADQDRELGGSTVDEGNLAAPQKPHTLGFPGASPRFHLAGFELA